MTIIKSSGATKHSYQPAPVCLNCIDRGYVYWDASCSQCFDLVTSEDSLLSGSEIFALLRQWSPAVQSHIELLTEKALQLGVGVNDVDEITGMTLLHYAAIAGSMGPSDTQETTLKLVGRLIQMGAELRETRWTRMNPLQFAVFFDSHKVVNFLLEHQSDADLEQRCPEFFCGTLLHLAAFSGSTETAKLLLQMGADPIALDNLGLTPAEVAERAVERFPEDGELKQEASELVSLLSTALNLKKRLKEEDSSESLSLAEILLTDRGLSIGCRVRIKGNKFGTLRYCGDVKFAQGKWVGVELDLATGKHDGSVDGIRYFHCAQDKGVFVPIKCVEKLKKPSETKFGYAYSLNGNLFTKARAQSSTELFNMVQSNFIDVGAEVLVGNRQKGVVRYVGETHFANGLWYGIELDAPVGRNNGTVDDTIYFCCEENRGIFAPIEKVTRLANAPINNDLNANRSSMCQSNEPRAQVVVNGLNARGCIRYVGMVDFAPGIWFGLELESPVGSNDGEVLGRRYFRCSPGYGMFVKPTKVKPARA